MTTVDSPRISVTASSLALAVAAIFEAVGAPSASARLVADSLVDADIEGVSSHGVMLVPMYVDRVLAGSVDPSARPELVVDRQAAGVLDARHGFGQLSGDEAMRLAIVKAGEYGLGLVTVRNAFHFGMARRFALQAAGMGCVGIVSCNTRPLMPAPGGAERMVGNNPIAVALPSAGEVPVVIDMALSEAAMGKIRMAGQAGETIPPTWATDGSGQPTTDPAEAIEGMLLPTGGHKGFGLAFVLDLLAGVLASGGWGEAVAPLYGDPARRYNSSHLFLAVDVDHFRPRTEVEDEVAAAAQRVRASTLAPGAERVYSPGEPEWERRRASNGVAALSRPVLESLAGVAARLQMELPAVEVRDAIGEGDDVQQT